MNSDQASEAARIQASNSLLDRGLGKPMQAVSVDVTVNITRIERTIVDPLVIEGECEDVTAKLISHDESNT